MDLKDFPNTKAIPLKSAPDRKNMPDLDYKLLKEKKAERDEIPGGLADDKTEKDIADKHKTHRKRIRKQIQKGVGIEKEHTKDKSKRKEISKDHLMEDPDYYTKLDKMEKGAMVWHSCETCTHFLDRAQPPYESNDCMKDEEVIAKHGEEDYDQWITLYEEENKCSFWEPMSLQAADSMHEDEGEIQAQTNINLVDKSAPSVDNDRKDIKDRKRHRVRFRNEPDGIREKEFDGLTEYHNVHRTDGEDRYNDPGDPRRGY